MEKEVKGLDSLYSIRSLSEGKMPGVRSCSPHRLRTTPNKEKMFSEQPALDLRFNPCSANPPLGCDLHRCFRI